jgi:hypothetical protein
VDQLNFKNSKEQYFYHLEEYKKFSGSVRAYCKLNNLSDHKFSYYKSLQQEEFRKSSSFAKVKIDSSAADNKSVQIKQFTVDPIWLAEFVQRLVCKK